MSREPSVATDADPGHGAYREVRDPSELKALAHPTRMALLEALKMHGALTATQASVYVGESPSSCSFHLRTLARYGFVEESGERQGRQRPWRAVSRGLDVPAIHGDPEASAAADHLIELFYDQMFHHVTEYWARRKTEPAEWQEAATSAQDLSWLTPGELTELSHQIQELLRGYNDRNENRSVRPDGARPVEVIYFAFPRSPVGEPPSDAAG